MTSFIALPTSADRWSASALHDFYNAVHRHGFCRFSAFDHKRFTLLHARATEREGAQRESQRRASLAAELAEREWMYGIA